MSLLKKRLAMLMAAGALVFGAKAQEPDHSFHEPSNSAKIVHREKSSKSSESRFWITTTALNTLTTILMSKKRKKRRLDVFLLY